MYCFIYFVGRKLDCGTDERIMLVSRDEQSCLVVSYKEVKACIESAFRCALPGGMIFGSRPSLSFPVTCLEHLGST